MSVMISGRYLGGFKTENTHEPSQVVIRTAAPIDNAGDGSSFSPTDLFATSFATCVVTTTAIKAESKGIDLTGAHYRVEKIMHSNPRRIQELRLSIHFPRDVPESERGILEAVAKSCPVHRSAHPDVMLTTEYHYDA